jgi:hypothetical protein
VRRRGRRGGQYDLQVWQCSLARATRSMSVGQSLLAAVGYGLSSDSRLSRQPSLSGLTLLVASTNRVPAERLADIEHLSPARDLS